MALRADDEELYDPADSCCRRCGSRATHATVDSNFGRYMRCNNCGDIWHAERRRQSVETSERRRLGDRRPGDPPGVRFAPTKRERLNEKP